MTFHRFVPDRLTYAKASFHLLCQEPIKKIKVKKRHHKSNLQTQRTFQEHCTPSGNTSDSAADPQHPESEISAKFKLQQDWLNPQQKHACAQTDFQ